MSGKKLVLIERILNNAEEVFCVYMFLMLYISFRLEGQYFFRHMSVVNGSLDNEKVNKKLHVAYNRYVDKL